MKPFTTLELCAGAGGQALGLEQAGIEHVALVEIEPHACKTLRLNRPHWNVIQQDIRKFDAASYQGVDIVSGGLPCPPFSVAGKQLGDKDERNLFPAAIRIISEARPRAVRHFAARGSGRIFPKGTGFPTRQKSDSRHRASPVAQAVFP